MIAPLGSFYRAKSPSLQSLRPPLLRLLLVSPRSPARAAWTLAKRDACLAVSLQHARGSPLVCRPALAALHGVLARA